MLTNNEPGSAMPWNTKRLAGYGAMLGVVVSIIHAYVHAFWSQIPEDGLLEHVLWTIPFRVVAGAALFAAVSAIRNWLIRKQ
jgi:hypothetical protein